MNFFQKLNHAISQNQTLLVLGLDANPEMMPSTLEDFNRNGMIGWWIPLSKSGFDLLERISHMFVSTQKPEEPRCNFPTLLGVRVGTDAELFTLILVNPYYSSGLWR